MMTTQGLNVVESDTSEATAEVKKEMPPKWWQPKDKSKVKKTDYLYWPLLVIMPEAITPNMLSGARLMVALPLILAMYLDFDKLAAYTFITVAIIDGLDGALARWRDIISTKGALLDPTADKADNFAVFIGFLFKVTSSIYRKLIAAIMIIDCLLFSVACVKYLIKDYFPHLDNNHWLRDWINPEDILMTVEVVQTGANRYGKIKMVIQVIVLSALLFFNPNTSVRLHETFSFLPVKLTLLEVSYPLLILCIIFGILSLIGHLKVVKFKNA